MAIHLVKDPVCGMEIDPTTAAGKSEYKDETYYFCAVPCKVDFDKDPETYLDTRYAPAGMPGQSSKKWWQFWK